MLNKLRRLFFLLPPTFYFLAACNQALPVFGPTATPTSTLTPTATLTPTPTPTPKPSPTPQPAARLTEADAALYAGDWERAIIEYQIVLEQSAKEQLRASAYLGLGKARLYGGAAQEAVKDFAAVFEQYPNSSLVADAHFLLGETFRALGMWEQSLEGYANYQRLRGAVIDSYIEERRAQIFSIKGEWANAVEAYRAAVAAPRADEGETFELRARIAESLLASGEWQAAADEYESQLIADTNVSRQARALVLAGDIYYNNGNTEHAYEHYQDALNRFPESPHTFQALLKLVNDGVAVDEFQRGLVNYHAANYEPALAAFERVLAVEPNNIRALYQKGLTLNALQRNAEAITAFRQLIANAPSDPLWAEAYFQIAFIQEYPPDVQAFRDFVAAAPQNAQAPEALFRAARLCERNGDLAQAAQLWNQLAQDYPQASQAADAAIQAGVVLYRLEDLARAAQSFELASTLGSDVEQHARAWLWLGKVLARQGNTEGAREAWAQAAALDPGSYYALRAAQLLENRALFTEPADFDFTHNAEREKTETERWLRETFPAAQNLNDVSQLSESLRTEPRFLRGAELWRLGLLQEAHAEFNSLRLAVQTDAVAMWQLALYWHEIGAYDQTIRAARQILDLAGLQNPDSGPIYLQRLRYPAPFEPLVVAASAEFGPHPFVMYSKMRIESFFWKYAFSSASARGLNQIIPSTAEDIARKLTLSNFEQADLFRPVISIPMGAYYLNYVGEATGGDTAARLSGYYAGPGNAQAWLNLAQGDPDLFLEVIRLPDAKGYVQTTFIYFEMYNKLYGKQ